MFSRIISVFLLLIAVSLYSQDKKNIPFAELREGKVIYKVDTITYKKTLSEKLLPGRNVTFNKIEIRRQLTLGTGLEFYYFLLQTENEEIKVAKWLNRTNDVFYINDELEEGDLCEQMYLICEGKGKCYPNVYEDGTMRLWGCSDIVGCGITDGVTPTCTSTQSIIE
jgi:hypothetical protein